MVMDPELQSLLIVCGIHHDRPSFVALVNCALPEQVADPCGGAADEYARTDFGEPLRQVASEAGGHSCQGENEH